MDGLALRQVYVFEIETYIKKEESPDALGLSSFALQDGLEL